MGIAQRGVGQVVSCSVFPLCGFGLLSRSLQFLVVGLDQAQNLRHAVGLLPSQSARPEQPACSEQSNSCFHLFMRFWG